MTDPKDKRDNSDNSGARFERAVQSLYDGSSENGTESAAEDDDDDGERD